MGYGCFPCSPRQTCWWRFVSGTPYLAWKGNSTKFASIITSAILLCVILLLRRETSRVTIVLSLGIEIVKQGKSLGQWSNVSFLSAAWSREILQENNDSDFVRPQTKTVD